MAYSLAPHPQTNHRIGVIATRMLGTDGVSLETDKIETGLPTIAHHHDFFTLIPNVMNFENPPQPPGEYTQDLRRDLGVKPDELFFLQPTRVVQRKGIEHAIEFTHRLGVKARLVISHAPGDEGYTYEDHLQEFARLLAVPVNFVSDVIQPRRNRTINGRKIYALWDVYPHADLITCPSDVEENAEKERPQMRSLHEYQERRKA